MDIGYKLLLTGLLLAIAGFILSYEYPKVIDEGVGTIIAIGSLVIIVIGALVSYKLKPPQKHIIC